MIKIECGVTVKRLHQDREEFGLESLSENTVRIHL
jgi:hypothetical protein